jgi:hypothetical protein
LEEVDDLLVGDVDYGGALIEYSCGRGQCCDLWLRCRGS